MSKESKISTRRTQRPPLFIETSTPMQAGEPWQNQGACYKIGKIGKPHGVKGEVTFIFEDDVFDRVDAQYLALDIDGILVPFFMEEYRFRSNESALVKFCDVDTQEQARQLTGCPVYFPRHLSDHSDDIPSRAAIINFQLIDFNTQRPIGKIVSVDDSTLNILFEVQTDEGKNLLIPASEELIKTIDTGKRHISVELPQGILDLE